MMTDEEIVAVVQAHIDGKKIQSRPSGGGGQWYYTDPTWEFDDMEYRVAPEPFRCWALLDGTGMIVCDYGENKELAITEHKARPHYRLVHLQEIPE